MLMILRTGKGQIAGLGKILFRGLLLAVPALAPAYLAAQELPAPKEVFPRDYAIQSGGLSEPESKSPTREPKIETPRVESPDSNVATPEAEETPDKQEVAGQPIPVRAIGAVVNAMDVQHFSDTLQELAEVVIRFDLEVGKIYVIGDLKHFETAKKHLTKLIARGGVLRLGSKPPAELNVTLSPAWILYTDKGRIILEATGQLDRYLNSRGEFVDKRQPAQEPAPEEKNEYQVLQ